MERLGMEEDQPIEHRLVTKSIETAQRRVEAHNLEIRKHLLEYDDVMNQQREVIYEQRRQILEGEDLKENLLGMIEDVLDEVFPLYVDEDAHPEDWDQDGLRLWFERFFGFDFQPGDIDHATITAGEIRERLLNQIQDLENEGYQFEVAEASFEILLRKALGRWHSFFELDHYRTVILHTPANQTQTEAIVKLRIDGITEHRVAEGDGPVNALDEALRRGLRPHYPVVSQMRLVDYKVRVINPRAGTAAKVCVVIQSRDDEHQWGTVGVSENIIDASWLALVDAVEYKLLLEEDKTAGKRQA